MAVRVLSLLGWIPGAKSGLLRLALHLLPRIKEKQGQVVALKGPVSKFKASVKTQSQYFL